MTAGARTARSVQSLLMICALGLAGCYSSSRATPPLSAAGFTVAVVAAASESGNDDQVLVGAQTAAVTHLRAALPAAWSEATRGLGTLTIVAKDAGIVMKVVAASGTSIHRSLRNKASDIVIFVADEGRPLGQQELTSTAVHELGHIWCCRGPEASDGHWTTPMDDGAEFGLNRYGLMNSPVGCNTQRGGSSLCPTRFSGRELAAMAFSSLPTVTPDPCVAQAQRLKRQIDLANQSLTASEATISSQQRRVNNLKRDVESYDVYRFSGVPSRIYPAYVATLDEYNDAVDRLNGLVAQHNRQVAQQDVAVNQYKSLAPRCVT